MKVVITKCSGSMFWYKDYIGQTFDVIDRGTSMGYLVLGLPDKSKQVSGYIDKEDGMEIDEWRNVRLNTILNDTNDVHR